MKNLFIIIIFLTTYYSCATYKATQIPVQEKIANLKNANGDDVLVAVHRAGWRYAPENSLQAIQNSIDMGADIIEIDVRKTKDGQLVLMHDKTIDRTTTGKGLLSDWTLKDLKKLYLKTGAQTPSRQKIPTLQEAMLKAKGKILVNIDKSYKIFDEVFKVLEETGTTDITIIKAGVPYKKVKNEFGKYLDKVFFMPIINLNKPGANQMIEEYITQLKPVAFEFVFDDESSPVLNQFKQIRQRGSRVWANSLWAKLDAGYTDDKAAYSDRNAIYGWYIKKGVNMIQTDRPKLLLNYLRSKGLHK